RCIEHFQKWEPQVAPRKNVEAAPRVIGWVRAGSPVLRNFRDVRRDRRKHTWAADLAVQFAADCEQTIADRFAFESHAVLAREPFVLRIARQSLTGWLARLLIRRREENQLVHLFDAPA